MQFSLTLTWQGTAIGLGLILHSAGILRTLSWMVPRTTVAVLLSSVNHVQAWIPRSAASGCFSKPCSTRTVVIRPGNHKERVPQVPQGISVLKHPLSSCSHVNGSFISYTNLQSTSQQPRPSQASQVHHRPSQPLRQELLSPSQGLDETARALEMGNAPAPWPVPAPP